jgi:hypothetical protein
MIRINCRLAPVINDHLPIEGQAESRVLLAENSKNGGNHPACNVTINFYIWGVIYPLKNPSYMYNTVG